METILAHARSLPIRVLVVWEPILPTDWMRPGGRVQSRLGDNRVIQFWDRGHLVASQLQRQLTSTSAGYHHRGTLWDFVALYGKDARWDDAHPTFTGGPVVMVAAMLARKLTPLSAANLGH